MGATTAALYHPLHLLTHFRVGRIKKAVPVGNNFFMISTVPQSISFEAWALEKGGYLGRALEDGYQNTMLKSIGINKMTYLAKGSKNGQIQWCPVLVYPDLVSG